VHPDSETLAAAQTAINNGAPMTADQKLQDALDRLSALETRWNNNVYEALYRAHLVGTGGKRGQFKPTP
jgi:hypothetical protein